MFRARRHIFLNGIAMLMLSGCTVRAIGDEAVMFTSVDQLLAAFVLETEALSLPDMQLSFAANLSALGAREELRQQEKVFLSFIERLGELDTNALDLCRRIDVSIATAEARFGVRRAVLGQKFLEFEDHAGSASRLSELELGNEWYQYFLSRWNGADLDADAVYAFGEAQLAQAVEQYDAIVRQLGFSDDVDGLAQYLRENEKRLDGGEQTLRLFERTQATVNRNMPSLFSTHGDVGPARIARSDRGESFPVPGYYEPDTDGGTFFYNLVASGFDARQADWLFLHEATPGHHFQFGLAAHGARCQSRLPPTMQPAYTEGWAAYVETLGEQLGLYATLEARLAAVEWDMVRSVRVVLDVALNAYGWEPERALAYWHSHVRGQRDIAQREIDRMLRWPAQVVTYKYGADVFLQMRKRVVLDDSSESLRRFHDTTLAFGPMPLAIYQRLFVAMMSR